MVTVIYKTKDHKVRKVECDFYNRFRFHFYPLAYVNGRFL